VETVTVSPWTLGFETPVAVSFALDRSSDEAITVREGDGGLIQLFVGADVWLTITIEDEVATIVGDELPDDIVEGVLEISRIPAPTEDLPTPESNPEMFRAPGPEDPETEDPEDLDAEDPDAEDPDVEDLDAERQTPAPDNTEAEHVGPEIQAPVDPVFLAPIHDVPIVEAPSVGLDFEDTIVEANTTGPTTTDPNATDPGATAEVAVDNAIPAAPAPEPEPMPASMPASVGIDADFVDDTIIIPPKESAEPYSATPIDNETPQQAPIPTIRISDASGSRLRQVTEPLFLGRAPRLPQGESGVLLQLASPAAQVSSSHLQLSPGLGGAVFARDLNSTNGTVITPPIGMPFRLSPGEQYPLPEGSRIDLGDGVVVSILGSTIERT
jgi:hypothetical protein